MTGTRNQPASRPLHVLVVSYYFPPMGLSGVQRVARFVKYLPESGWNVTVLTVAPRGYFAFDDSLSEDLPDSVQVIRTSSLDPTWAFGNRSQVRLPRERTRERLSAISQFIFVPDNKIGWYLPAVRRGRRVHLSAPIDVVFSSAPPYTAHLAARSIARFASAPLVVDFRDDWLENPRHSYATTIHRSLQKRLEASVVTNADAIITINPKISSDIASRYVNQISAGSIRVIPHGFDPQDFEDAPPSPATEHMTFLYTGIFYDAQSPEPFLRGLRSAIALHPELRSVIRAEFAGIVPPDFDHQVKTLGLESVVRFHGYVPHSALVRILLSADVLWMTIGRRPGSEGISTGKLYEYFGTGRPILGLVPSGVARNDLVRYGASVVSEPDDEKEICAAILKCFDHWRNKSFPSVDEAFVEGFNRRVLSKHLSNILHTTIESRRRTSAIGSETS